jgi:cell division protein FtsB
MKRALLIVISCVVIAAIAYTVMTHPNLDRVDHLQGELQKLEAQNQRLADENRKLQETIVALRDDPRLAERRARAAGMARPGELVFQFEEPDKPIPVQAILKVSADACELAGKNVALTELSLALDSLKEQLPGATLKVSFKEDVDALQRQHVVDSIEASAFGGAEFEDD